MSGKDDQKGTVENGHKRLKVTDVDDETLHSGAEGYVVHFVFAPAHLPALPRILPRPFLRLSLQEHCTL